MAGGTDSAALLQALLAELELCAQEEAFGADALAAGARDHDRWGLAGEAAHLRQEARQRQIRALLRQGKAASWRVQADNMGRAQP